jgi:hypothetical protein
MITRAPSFPTTPRAAAYQHATIKRDRALAAALGEMLTAASPAEQAAVRDVRPAANR